MKNIDVNLVDAAIPAAWYSQVSVLCEKAATAASCTCTATATSYTRPAVYRPCPDKDNIQQCRRSTPAASAGQSSWAGLRLWGPGPVAGPAGTRRCSSRARAHAMACGAASAAACVLATIQCPSTGVPRQRMRATGKQDSQGNQQARLHTAASARHNTLSGMSHEPAPVVAGAGACSCSSPSSNCACIASSGARANTFRHA